METLFASNEIYPISDKYAIQLLSMTKIASENLEEKVDIVLAFDVEALKKECPKVKSLFTEIVFLTTGL